MAAIGFVLAKALAEEMAKQVINEVGDGRWVKISVKNECGFDLEKVSVSKDILYGKEDNVPARIEQGHFNTIAVRNNLPFTGVKGILKYKLVDHPDNIYMTIYFKNPVHGHNYHNVQFSNDLISDSEMYARARNLKSDTKDFATTRWEDSVYAASWMTGDDKFAMGIGLTAGTVKAGGEEKSFQSHFGNYLRAHKNGDIDLAPHCEDFEKWHMIYHDADTCSLRSFHGAFLQANSDGKIDSVANRGDRTKWRITRATDKIALQSCYESFIGAKEDKSVHLVGACKAWELWTV